MADTALPPHPGFVIFETAGLGETHRKPVAEMPESKRYHFFRDGKPVAGPDEADEIVPVVRIRMTAVGPDGGVVAASDAVTVHIVELGPDERVLKRTTSRRRPPKPDAGQGPAGQMR